MSDDETPLLGGIQAETGPVVRVAREGASSGGRSRGSSSSSGGRCCGVRRVDRRWLAAALALGLVLLSLALALSFRKPSHPSNKTNYDVYCHGPLLDAVQTLHIFNDSKEFVDMPMKAEPGTILKDFTRLNSRGYSKEDLADFVDQNFLPAGNDTEGWTPPDFNEDLPFAADIANESLRAWTQDVHKIWPSLGRRCTDAVSRNPEQYSMLYVPNGFVVPGGRFREGYYWDTFFIIKGLIASNMVATAQGMVENMLTLVADHGFVPNGFRIYYLNRSQPPMMTLMVELVYNATKDRDFLSKAFPLLQTEYEYWNSAEKQCTVNGFVVSRYYAHWTDPRPENYAGDQQVASQAKGRAASDVYREIATAAETGWDFSSRWFETDNMTTVRTSNIVPVDLNTILALVEDTLGRLAKILGQSDSAWRTRAAARRAAIQALMWNSTSLRWNDVLADTGAQITDKVTPAAWYPLWANMQPTKVSVDAVLSSFNSSGLALDGGIMTSLDNTTQQWDKPNAWPPIQWILAEAMRNIQTASAQNLGELLACRWLGTMFLAYQKTHLMYEKYDAMVPGEGGGGGEYVPQIGFGWTNGVMLAWMKEFAEGTLNCDASFFESS